LNKCRNCAAQELKTLGFIGEVAPFFLKRVLNLEFKLAPTGHPVKRFFRNLGFVSAAFQKIYAKSVLSEMQLCTSCLFIQTTHPFSEDAIGNLYADYRSDSYNRERILYEPEYAAIAAHVGASAKEIRTRKTGLTQWLEAKLDQNAHFSMLDFGGANGMFLPDLRGQKYVFDISKVQPAEQVTRVKDESELRSYSYIQLAHVLEHVPFPRALTLKAASLLQPSGYLYIEVPQELSDDAIERLANDGTARLSVHEHINQYCLRSVNALMRSVGLSVVSAESESVDLGWNKGTILRALGRKN
jgi:hypothetical protein